jgi:hypothetical protein
VRIPYSEAALAEMAEHLDRVDEFAVDLEHHSYRSFQVGLYECVCGTTKDFYCQI